MTPEWSQTLQLGIVGKEKLNHIVMNVLIKLFLAQVDFTYNVDVF